MILIVVTILLVAGIAYFHYAQGFFSATMSAVCAVVAAVLAVSYHEVVVQSLLKGAIADYADGLVLGAIFALVYIVLRVIIDKAVPGNLRLPNIFDRVGGAVMGLVAGVFTAGVVALAAQMLPFGPAVGGYARYALETRTELDLPPDAQSRGSHRTADINDQMVDDRFSPDKRAHLYPAVDDIVLSVVQSLSDGGSLAADQTLESVHPNYPDELFGQRLGIQLGGRHTASNLPGKTPQVNVPDKGVFRDDADLSKGAIDNELNGLHQRPVTYVHKPNDLQLVVRVIFNKDAADSDGLVRLSLGSVRLVAGGTDYWPIGTLENAKTLYLNKIDDYLFIDVKSADHGADFVFDIDDPSKVVTGGAKDTVSKIKDGVFIEVKRLARIDLSGREVITGVTPAKEVKVERKTDVGPKKKEGAAAVPTATEFTFTQINISNKLFSPINTGTPDKDVRNAQTQSGTLSMVNHQLSQLDINPTQSLTVLKQGGYTVDDLYVPGNQKLVQIMGAPPAEGGDPWAWAALSKWQLIDVNGKTFKPAGAWARVSKENAERMVAVYNATDPVGDIANTDGRPIDVWVAFLVPTGTQLKEVKFNDKLVKDDLGLNVQ